MLALLLSGCAVHTLSFDRDVGFATHQERRELVVDRPLAGTLPDVVTAASVLRAPGGAAWALRRGDDVRAAYWLDGDAGTIARAGMHASDAALGEIRPHWDDNAIRLRIEPPGGPAIDSDVFARTDSNGGTTALTRSARSVLDLRGRFRAALRDPQGREVGWLGLRLGPYEPAPRIYEGSLPAGVDEQLGVAAVLALASELDWIEAHTLNVYEGDRGPLIQSVPIH